MPNSHLFNVLFAVSLACPAVASLTTSPLPPSIPPNATHIGWVNEPNSGRGTETIIWPCLSTIILCVYVANHLNIPFEALSGRMAFWRKTFWIALGLLFPELMCLRALVEWLNARKLARRCESLGYPISRQQAFVISSRGIGLRNLHLPNAYDGKGAKDHGESAQDHNDSHKYHGKNTRNPHAAIGSHDVESQQPSEMSNPPKSYEHGTVWICSTILDSDGDLSSTDFCDDDLRLIGSVIPSNEEISSRSKADGVAKLLTVLQTTWSLVQITSRWTQNLEISVLEYATLAYVVMSMITYCFWFHKPYDVGSPFIIEVDRDSKKIFRPVDMRTWTTIYELSWKRCKSSIKTISWVLHLDSMSGGGVSLELGYGISFIGLTCAVFGGIHCLAWKYGFSTQAEAWLWRVSSILTVVIPTAFFLLLSVDWLGNAEFVVGIVILIIYALLRIYMIIECFLAFRNAPVGIYRKVSWASHWPHFGG